LIRGKKAFRVIKVQGQDDRFQFEGTDAALKFHRVTVRFRGSDQPGPVESDFRIETDLPGETATALRTTVQIVP
jgi:hypothetical protein